MIGYSLLLLIAGILDFLTVCNGQYSGVTNSLTPDELNYLQQYTLQQQAAQGIYQQQLLSGVGSPPLTSYTPTYNNYQNYPTSGSYPNVVVGVPVSGGSYANNYPYSTSNYPYYQYPYTG
ncbi:uncharacterized protein LOC129600049 [Paramacrobiotus metropolitanus]|uniref:uncharacterized protein LOC129600049 n=1 Tax=Paramacrobiotus metropolitanus TaxID=2943436 RepID=UPI002445C35E|nr:uncharacterized protein LOC129600049 [Paramacrobiotus metropolitanus]